MTDAERDVLEARLADAETALHELLIGKSAVSLGYDGESGTFTAADEGKLRRYIAELKGQLCTACNPRRPGVRA